jgi:hypothetical protein
MVYEKLHCSFCGKEITNDESRDYEGLYWECRENQLTEETDSMFDELM